MLDGVPCLASRPHPTRHPLFLPSALVPFTPSSHSSSLPDPLPHSLLGNSRLHYQVVSEVGGVRHFVIHARKCLLSGLSPAQNRSVPPLRHEWVWALKRDFPHLFFSLNGGLQNGWEAAGALGLDVGGVGTGAVSGVMIGRAAYNDPWGVLGDADVAVWGEGENLAGCRREVLEAYCEYSDMMLGRCGEMGFEGWVFLVAFWAPGRAWPERRSGGVMLGFGWGLGVTCACAVVGEGWAWARGGHGE